MNTHTDRLLLKPWAGRGRGLLTLGLIATLSGASLFAEMRTWRTQDGRRFEAEYSREIFGTVYFKDAGRNQISIDLENLSETDINHLRTTVPPEMDLKFSKRTLPKERSIYRSQDDNITLVTGIVEVKKTSRLPFDGTLRAELYMVGKEVATDHLVLLGKESSRVKFTEENRGRYEFRSTVEERTYREYNNQMRGADYEGHLLLVIGPQGNIMESETDLSWLDENEYEKLRALPVRTFFNESVKKRPVPRPKYYTDGWLFGQVLKKSIE